MNSSVGVSYTDTHSLHCSVLKLVSVNAYLQQELDKRQSMTALVR